MSKYDTEFNKINEDYIDLEYGISKLIKWYNILRM